MKKSLDVKHIKSLEKGIKKIRSKSHCKLSRNEQAAMVLFEVNVILEQTSHRKSAWKKILFSFFKTLRSIAKLLKKVLVVNVFSL